MMVKLRIIIVTTVGNHVFVNLGDKRKEAIEELITENVDQN